MNALKPRRHPLVVSLALILAVGFCACAQQQQPAQEQRTTGNIDKTVRVDWTWKRTVKGDANVIYGTVHNTGEQSLKQIVLEFYTQNTAGDTLDTHEFSIENLAAGGQKPFSQDYPARAAHEDSGFVTIKKVIPAD